MTNNIYNELDFEKLGLSDLLKNSEATAKYTIMRFLASEGMIFCAKYISRFQKVNGDMDALLNSLSFDEYIEILKKTMADEILIKANNFDSIFKDKIYEARCVILASLCFHLESTEKKNSGTKVNSTQKTEA